MMADNPYVSPLEPSHPPRGRATRFGCLVWILPLFTGWLGGLFARSGHPVHLLEGFSVGFGIGFIIVYAVRRTPIQEKPNKPQRLLSFPVMVTLTVAGVLILVAVLAMIAIAVVYEGESLNTPKGDPNIGAGLLCIAGLINVFIALLWTIRKRY